MGASKSTDKYLPPLVSSLTSMAGKTVAITGCTSGTGLTAANVIARLGGRVILLNRPSERATQAEQAVKATIEEAKLEGGGGGVVHINCDLMDFASVREACAKMKEECTDGLDVLCNNAGIMAMADAATKDGFDIQMQTNHLSHFLLTAELYPLLQEAAEKRGEARIVNHSSIARKGVPLDEKYFGKNGGNLGGDDTSMSGPRWKRYQQTKLSNLVFTLALGDKLLAKNSKVKALCAHPGVATTSLMTTTKGDGGMSGMAASFTKMVSQSANDGACGIIACMCLPDVKTREFYGPKGRGISGPAVRLPILPNEDDSAQKELLWKLSCAAVSVDFFSEPAAPEAEAAAAAAAEPAPTGTEPTEEKA